MKRHLVLILLTACATNADTGDGADDAFLSTGKSDSNLTEGSPEALGVLRVANELPRSQLDDDVGLTSTTAKSIDAYRLGPDATASTADDRTFHTLAELDAVKYVGPVAFQHLLAYAQAHGYVTGSGAGSGSGTGTPTDVWTPETSCTPMSFEELATYFPPGAKEADVGTFTLRERARDSCTQYTGCSPWLDPVTPTMVQKLGFDDYHTGQGSTHTLPTSGVITLYYDPSLPSINVLFTNLEPGVSDMEIRMHFEYLSPGQLEDKFGENGFFEVEWVSHPLGGTPPMYFGSALGYDGDLTGFTGRMCSDGSFHIASQLTDSEVPVQYLTQFAVWGQLNH